MLVSLKTSIAPIAHSVERGAYIIYDMHETPRSRDRRPLGADGIQEFSLHVAYSGMFGCPKHANELKGCLQQQNIMPNTLHPGTAQKTRMSERPAAQGHPTKPPSSMGDYEDVRVVKETGLRSVGASLVGSTPTPRKEFVWFSQNLHFLRYGLAVRIGLFHSLGPGSTPGIGIKFGSSLKSTW